MNFFRQYILHNIGLKLLSLVLAVGLWLAVSRDPVAEIALDVPIEFHNIPSNLEISSEHIPEAQIRVRGPARLVRRLQSSDIHTEIDLTGVKPGERTFDLTSQQVRQLRGLDVVQVIPGQVRLAFDTRATRQVEVRPRVNGTFASGYQIGQVIADPPVITISGPTRRVEKVEAAITDSIDVTGDISRATFVTHAYVADPLVQVLNTDTIHVTVVMQKSPGGDTATVEHKKE